MQEVEIQLDIKDADRKSAEVTVWKWTHSYKIHQAPDLNCGKTCLWPAGFREAISHLDFSANKRLKIRDTLAL